MKKIVTLIICVAVVLAMAVPAFAENTTSWLHAYGSVMWNEDIDIDIVGTVYYPVEDASSNGVPVYNVVVNGVGKTISYNSTIVYRQDTGWVDDAYRILTFGLQGRYIEAFQVVLDYFGTILCDGSSCPATDVDNDGVCDDCGSVLMRSVAPSGPSVIYETYNGVRLPTISTVWNDTGAYTACIIFKDKASDTYHLIYGSYYDKDYMHYNTAVSGSPQTYCSIHNWSWYDLIDDNWTFQTANTNDVICRVETYDLIWANQTIYTDSTRENPFFQLPPTVEAPTLAGVITAETLAGALKEVVAILPTGLVCLVGYLTLRKALKVLQTVLYQA